MSGSVVTSGCAGSSDVAGGAGGACVEEIAAVVSDVVGFAGMEVAVSIGLRGRSFFTLSMSGCMGTPALVD